MQFRPDCMSCQVIPIYPEWSYRDVPVVEPGAAFLDGTAQSRHSRDVFSDGDGPREEIVNHRIGQHQIDEGLGVNVHPEILIVVAYGKTVSYRWILLM